MLMVSPFATTRGAVHYFKVLLRLLSARLVIKARLVEMSLQSIGMTEVDMLGLLRSGHGRRCVYKPTRCLFLCFEFSE